MFVILLQFTWPDTPYSDAQPGLRDAGSADRPGWKVRKQTRDTVRLLESVKGVSRYHLFIEDDMRLCPYGFSALRCVCALRSCALRLSLRNRRTRALQEPLAALDSARSTRSRSLPRRPPSLAPLHSLLSLLIYLFTLRTYCLLLLTPLFSASPSLPFPQIYYGQAGVVRPRLDRGAPLVLLFTVTLRESCMLTI